MSAATASPIVERQLAALKSTFPNASLVQLSDGTSLISVPDFPLPSGWNKSTTGVWFVLPVGYDSGARPDCFWSDLDLRLANGNDPQNSNQQQLPGTGGTARWFSWHLTTWSAATDTILTYLNSIRDRFRRGT